MVWGAVARSGQNTPPRPARMAPKRGHAYPAAQAMSGRANASMPVALSHAWHAPMLMLVQADTHSVWLQLVMQLPNKSSHMDIRPIALPDAEALQQRGERRKGQEAVPLLQQATVRLMDSHQPCTEDSGRWQSHDCFSLLCRESIWRPLALVLLIRLIVLRHTLGLGGAWPSVGRLSWKRPTLCLMDR